MAKKKFAIVIIALILLSCAFFFVYTHNTVKAGNTYFNIPDGYSALNKKDYINLTNGNNSIGIVKDLKDTNLQNSINAYTNSKKDDNISISNYKVGDHTVFKSVSARDPNIVHYWVECNGKVNEFFSWSGDANSDKIVNELLNSTKYAFI